MIKISHLFLIVFSLLGVLACSDDEEIVPIIEPGLDSYTMAMEGGEFVLPIHATGEWTLMSDAVWCQVEFKEGVGDAEVPIRVQMNQSGNERTAKLTLASGEQMREIVVVQSTLILVFDSLNIASGIGGGTYQLNVYSNGNWTAKCDADWLRISPESGRDTGVIEVWVDSNAAGAMRNTSIVVKSGNLSRTLIWTQEGAYIQHLDKEWRLYREEDRNNPIKLVFMGDGFTKEHLRDGGLYDQTMVRAIEGFFEVEPYKSYRDYFCPYIVYACSEQAGVTYLQENTKDTVLYRNTALGAWTYLNTLATTVGVNQEKTWEYTKLIPNIELTKSSTVVAVNANIYRGTCAYSRDGRAIAMITTSSAQSGMTCFENVVMHEACGHAFGLLADEYYGEFAEAGDNAEESLKSLHDSYMSLNVSANQDGTTVYWHDFIGRPGYEDVGFYEGANLTVKGYWRSEDRCCMIDNIPYFSIACRLAIVQRIKRIAGEPFDLDDFIAKDVQKSYEPSIVDTRTFEKYPPLAPPIFLD